MIARPPTMPGCARTARARGHRRSRVPASVAVLVALGSIFALACDDSAARRAEIDELMKNGQMEEALPLLEKELASDRRDAELLYRYGVAQLRLGRPSVAIWGLLEAREDPEWQARALLALIEVGIVANDREQSVDAATQLIELEPDNEHARLLRAESYIALRKFEEALADADWLLDGQEENVAGHTIRLQALLGLKRVDELEADFDRLEALATENAFPQGIAAKYCVARATFADEKGDAELATERFEECLAAYPSSGELMLAAVSFFDQNGNVARATEILADAVEASPEVFDLREALSNRVRQLGEVERAEQLLLEATEVAGESRTRAWAALAYHYFALEDFDKSVAAWDQLFEYLAAPDDGILFAYAEALIHSGRYDQAEAVAAELPTMMGELVLGLNELEQGRPQRALQHFEEGQRLWPNNAVARYFAGLAAERDGDIDRAITELRQSIRIRSTETPAALRLARIHLAEGRPEQARTALGHYLKDRPKDVEGRILSIRIAAALRGAGVVEPAFAAMRWPASQLGQIVARVARDLREIADPAITVRFLESVRQIDFARPSHADALRAYVDALVATGRAEEAGPLLDAALAAHPDVADFHEIRARWLLAAERPAEEVSRSLERALSLAPDSAPALATRARLAIREGRALEARRLFERAAAADRSDVASRLAAARIAIDQGDFAAAWELLSALRAEHPTDPQAAALLARVVLALGESPDLADRLARCALRFRGGDAVRRILEPAYEEQGRSDALGAILSSSTAAPPDAAAAPAPH